MAARERTGPGQECKRGTGTIVFVRGPNAYARPDQPGYGREIYIPGGLADKSCAYNLDTKYKIGDRIRFTYIKATKPELGCNWAATDLEKIYDSGVGNGAAMNTAFPSISRADSVSSLASSIGGNPKPTSQKVIICNAKGKIDSNGISFAYIELDPPQEGFAFMDDRSVKKAKFTDAKGVFSLTKEFPPDKRVICDLQPQKARNGCTYFARNVVAVEEKALAKSYENRPTFDKLNASQLQNARPSNFVQGNRPGLDNNKGFNPPISAKGAPLERGATKNISKQGTNNHNSNAATADAFTQTDTPTEMKLLEKIFNDQDIFQQICTRLPDVMYRYMRIRDGRNIADQ